MSFRHSIAFNLLRLTVLFGLAVTLILTAVELVREYGEQVAAIRRSLARVEDGHVDVLVNRLWSSDFEQVLVMMHGIRRNPDIAYVELSKGGQVLAAVGEKPAGDTLVQSFPLHYPVGARAVELGTLRLETGRSLVYRRLAGDVGVVLVSNAVLAFAVSLFLMVLFQRTITRHLTQVARYADSLSVGALDEALALHRPAVEQRRQDELDLLVAAINRMRLNLQTSYQALHEREALLNAVITHSPSAITLKDIEGHYLLANRMFEGWFGVPTGMVRGKTIFDFVPRADAEAFTANDQEVRERRDAITREATIAFPDGVTRLVWITKFPVFREDGTLLGTGAVLTDVTEHRRTEEQLRHAQKMEAVGQLTGGVAHDFNNILAIIFGNLEPIEEQLGDRPTLRDHAHRAIAATARGKTLTQRLLAFSRRQALRPAATDLNALVGGMVELLRRTLGETIEVHTRFDPGLGKVLVDASQLENAIVNLAVNARDAMPAGGVLTLETANTVLDAANAEANSEVAAGPCVRLTVTDTGSGMTPEVLAHAFDPFFTTKDVGRGSGLGLSMVYGFVKQSGGHVKLHSAPGDGTTVTLYLPRSDLAAAEAPVAPPATGTTADSRLILVVEDEAEVRSLAVTLLGALGYRTVEAADGREALERIGQHPEIALLFTDVVLPGGVSGVELARLATRRRPGLKVLLTSGYSANAMAPGTGQGLELPLLEKPYRKSDLAERVAALLEG